MSVKADTVIDLSKLYDLKRNKKQELAHQATERYILYGGAWGGGKTAWLINEGISLSLLYPGNRGFIGCKVGQDFKKNALNQLLKFLPRELYTTCQYTDSNGKLHVAHGVHHQTDQYFNLINGSVIYYGGIGNDAEAYDTINNMPELGWFAIDQAEEITENQFLLLTSRLRLRLPNIEYKGLLTANPDPGWLRDRFIENSYADHRFIPALPKDNLTNLPPDYEEKLKENLTPEMAKRLLEGDWDISEVTNYLIPYPEIREAINRNLPASGVKIAGVDISRYGDDETVFLLRQGHKVLHIESWGHQDTTFSAGKVAELIREHRPMVTNIDSIGIGVGVFDPLRAEGYNVREINVSEKPSKEEFVNKRAELYRNLAKRFERGEVDIPDNAKLSSQLASLRYLYKNTKLQIESKEIARKRGVKSPDFADALMLAFIDSTVKLEAHAYIGGRQIW